MRGFVFLLLMGVCSGALAQTAAPPPLSPSLIEQIAPTVAPRLAPSIRPPVPEAARGPNETVPIRVTGGRVTGNTVLSPAATEEILSPLRDREVTLGAIEEARVALVSRYGRAGYPFVTATASVSGTTEAAELTFAVIEGRVASVKLDGDIGPAGVQVLRFLQPLVSESPVTVGELERALLLAGDVPGVTVRSVVRPQQGGGPGALELVAQVTRRSLSGYAALDNRGSRFTGPLQALLAASANAFTSTGERVEVFLLGAERTEQYFGQVTAEAFVGGSGLRVRGYAGAGRAEPGSTLAALGYRGDTVVAGLGVQYPVIRSRALNLATVGAFDLLNSSVDVGLERRAPQSADAVRTLRVGFDASALDTLMPFAPAAATSTLTARASRGVSWFGATSIRDATGPGRAGSDFTFTKVTAEVTRSQPIVAFTENTVLSVYGLLAGQWTRDVLPLSEKFFLGGNRLGRGFYAGQVTGDRALAATVELRLDVALPAFTLSVAEGSLEIRPTTQLYGFYDYGRTRENLRTDIDRRVESAGFGLRTVVNDTVQFDLEAVRRFTRRVDAAGPDVPPLSETAGFFRALVRF